MEKVKWSGNGKVFVYIQETAYPQIVGITGLAG